MSICQAQTPWRWARRFCVVLACCLSLSAGAEEIRIAAASDLKFALDAIVADFKAAHSAEKINLVYGSSGKFFNQIQQSAPFDIFFSADIHLVRELEKKGFAGSAVIPYGFGRLVLWSATVDASKLTLADLTSPQFAHIAIANPLHAPYGKRAQEALTAVALWDKLQPKLVFGESIAETTQFVRTGNAQIGLIALALALSPELAKQGGYALVPEQLHSPLEQAFIITKRAQDNRLAKSFATYLNSEPARKQLATYGFSQPDDKPTSTHKKASQ